MIRKEAQQRTFDYIQKGIDEGADLLLDGRENIPEKATSWDLRSLIVSRWT